MIRLSDFRIRPFFSGANCHVDISGRLIPATSNLRIWCLEKNAFFWCCSRMSLFLSRTMTYRGHINDQRSGRFTWVFQVNPWCTPRSAPESKHSANSFCLKEMMLLRLVMVVMMIIIVMMMMMMVVIIITVTMMLMMMMMMMMKDEGWKWHWMILYDITHKAWFMEWWRQ